MDNNLLYLSQCWDCEKCTPQVDCFGKKLSPEERQFIKDAIKCQHPFKAEEKIFQIEKSFHFLYVIKTGAVKVQAITESGHEFVKGFYFPGDIIGIDSIGSDYYRNDAVALELTSLCAIPCDKLEQLCFTLPALHHEFVKKFAEEIITTENRLISQNYQTHTDERLMHFLGVMSRKIGRKQHDGTVRIYLPMTKGDVANYLGCRPESLSRTLVGLEKQGVIVNHAHVIDILKPAVFSQTASV